MTTRFMAKFIHPFVVTLNFLSPIGDLIVRLWIANIFFQSGLVKIQSWETTLTLFTYEYHVPLLSPGLAAMLGTGAELVLPILLAVGLGGRFIILIFFLYNIIAVVSYPFLWTPEGYIALQQHINWGLLLMMLMLHGSGKLSLDHWILTKFRHLLPHNNNTTQLLMREPVFIRIK